MTHSIRFQFAIFFLLLVLISSLAGCQAGAAPVAEPQPIAPTNPAPTEVPTEVPTAVPSPTPLPTSLPPSPTLPPTPAIAPTFTPAEWVARGLEPAPYCSAEGLLCAHAPTGWLNQFGTGQMELTAPDQTAYINLELIYTITQYDPRDLAFFAAAREENYFRGFDAYVQTAVFETPNGITIEKTLDFSGVVQKVVSTYRLAELAVVAVDFWADAPIYPGYDQIFQRVLETTQAASPQNSTLPPYSFRLDFSDPQGFSTFQVPRDWNYSLRTEGAITINEFRAPDIAAQIQQISYPDFSSSGAAPEEMTLRLVSAYLSQDAAGTSVEELADGGLRVEWSGPGSGFSIVYIRENTLLVLSFEAPRFGLDEVMPLFEELLLAYYVP